MSEKWWEAFPLAPTSAPQAPAGDKWYEAFPEITSTLSPIVDDPQRAAGAATIANASMFPNLRDRIPIYAKALGIPPSDFAMMEGQIVYRDPKNPNGYVRVEPSVSGATGPVDALKRVGLYAAGAVGPAIPAAASIAAGVATRGNIPSIAAAGAAGGLGDVARQAVGQWINGGNPTDIDLVNAAGQAGLGALGQGLSVAGRAMFDRVPAGLGAADRAWMREPANVANARANAELLRRQGITALHGPITNRGSLLHADRQLMRNAETADPMREVVRRVNTQEVPAAAQRTAGGIYPDEGLDVTARNFREAAKGVIESPRHEVNLASREAYAAAQATPDQWGPVFERILKNDEMKGLYRAAAVRAERDVTMGTPGAVSLPPLDKIGTRPAPAPPPSGVSGPLGAPPSPAAGPVTPPFEAWQYMRRELDARAAAAREARDFNTERQMVGLSKMLDDALRDVNPSYATAQTINRPGQQITARMNEGVLGGVAKTNPDAPSSEVLGKMFNASRVPPTAIAESRQAFINAGQVDAWDSAFAAYVRDVADKAGKTLASGDTGNVAGKIYTELFGDAKRREAAAAALGGRNTLAFKQFAETMEALNITSRIPAMGSQTATDIGQVGAVASPTARATATALRALNPRSWWNALGTAADWVEGQSAGKAAQRTAAGYLAGPTANGALLSGVRVMSPTTYGLLTGGTRGGVSFLPGLLAPQGDWQEYQWQSPAR